MDYATVVRAKKRMCYSSPVTLDGSCPHCPIWALALERGMSCVKYNEEYPERVEFAVMDWIKQQEESK